MNKKHTAQSAFFNLRILIRLLLCAVVACSLVSRPLLAFFRPEASTKDSQRTLIFAQRVAYQRAIEDVYWRHRIWPKERPDRKPSLDAVMSQAQLEKKVAVYLQDSQALEDYLQRAISAEDLQAEMDRMARDTKQPDVLRELFEALENDPFVIAECLVRPVLSERLITSFAQKQPKGGLALAEVGANSRTRKVVLANSTYVLPTISDATTGCTPNTWTITTTAHAAPNRLSHTAVWTGSEMIVWGGRGDGVNSLNTGGRYNPSTDSWVDTSTTNAPTGRESHTAVWTGHEMIVWGGLDTSGYSNTGGRYNPSTDSWTATSTANAPAARELHTAVWIGSEMIVWGGFLFDGAFHWFNTGGRYNPVTNSWTATSTTNAPEGRYAHTAIWTGSEMVIWGGVTDTGALNTGGRYNPTSNSWTTNSITKAPNGRWFHTAVWTGSQMIVWGGFDGSSYLNTGGRYNPSTDSWVADSTTNAPTGREFHTVVWTGSEMIVWGGDQGYPNYLGTGGRYNPGTDNWTATSTTNAPQARTGHTSVWTGSEMIIWGGYNGSQQVNTGGRYCAQSGAPTPTPTPTPRPTPTPTPTPTPDCYPNFTTAEGCNALSLLTTGAGNTGLGWYSLSLDTTGSFSTGVGAGALALNNADFQYCSWRGSALAQHQRHTKHRCWN
jgi:N-acetylneuraminic acid mutarotase